MSESWGDSVSLPALYSLGNPGGRWRYVLHRDQRKWASRQSLLTTLPEHRAQSVAALSGQRPKRYLEREHLLELGRPALEYLTELTHRRPRLWLRDVHRLHEPLQHHGPEQLRSAFQVASPSDRSAPNTSRTRSRSAPVAGISRSSRYDGPDKHRSGSPA
jgi:hypothetical protein